MSSNFFTNEEENTLKNKINHILNNDKNIDYLDFLIGYFRITGFDKISENLSHIKHTRILIGINADKQTYDATQLIKRFSKEQIGFYNQEPLDEKEYQNFFSMKDLISKKRIEIRISADRNVHSKMYIMRSEEKSNHSNSSKFYQGSLITTLWTNSSFISTVGGAPLEIIKQYIENQQSSQRPKAKQKWEKYVRSLQV